MTNKTNAMSLSAFMVVYVMLWPARSVRADDWQQRRQADALEDQASELHQMRNAMEVQNAMADTPKVVYVDAYPGCQFSEFWPGQKQKTVTDDSGRVHKLYVKICDDDPVKP